MRGTYGVCLYALAPALHLLYRFDADGVENLPPGGFVLAATHASNFDPWPLALPIRGRRLRFMAKSELFDNPVLGPVLRAGGAFSVQRGAGDTDAMATAVALVRAGEIVAMFPHGTRSGKGHGAQRLHRGAARIALESDAPLVPAAIAGTERLSRLTKIRVSYGPAVPLDDLRQRDLREAAQVGTDRLADGIERLRGPLVE